MHIPNNEDYTVTPDNGKMITAQGCTQISSVNPQIAAYRKAAGRGADRANRHVRRQRPERSR